jgi:enamine deaminase RidA (YjgF/YER057c/UK114 family)
VADDLTSKGNAVGPEETLKAMGLALPAPPSPAGAYVRAKRTGNLIFVAGQLPLVEGEVKVKGRLGGGLTLEQGVEAARICALNALSILKAEAGSLDRVTQLVRVEGFVASTPEFTDHPKVINGASELFSAVLGEAGSHARLAVGVSALPLGAAVEVAVVAEIQ